MDPYDAFIEQLSIPDVKAKALDHVLSNADALIPADGLILEFGVFSGSSITSIAKALPRRHVYGFDSFEGLPEDWHRTDLKFAKGAFSLEGQLPPVPQNVTLVKGWFDETLPPFLDQRADQKVSFLHVDCDLYSSTKTVFDAIASRNAFADRVLIVFDELVNYSTYRDHELRAFYEFLLANPEYSVQWIGMLGPLYKDSPRDFGAQYQSVACVITRKQP